MSNKQRWEEWYRRKLLSKSRSIPIYLLIVYIQGGCYGIDNSVGVMQISRLISRIRYRQFGIMMTTSYVDKQAYSEVVEYGHPILIVTAADIAGSLRNNSINTLNMVIT